MEAGQFKFLWVSFHFTKTAEWAKKTQSINIGACGITFMWEGQQFRLCTCSPRKHFERISDPVHQQRSYLRRRNILQGYICYSTAQQLGGILRRWIWNLQQRHSYIGWRKTSSSNSNRNKQNSKTCIYKTLYQQLTQRQAKKIYIFFFIKQDTTFSKGAKYLFDPLKAISYSLAQHSIRKYQYIRKSKNTNLKKNTDSLTIIH